MKKFVLLTASLGMILASGSAQASGLSFLKSTHIGTSAAYPQEARFRSASYHFDLHVVGNSISELLIESPEDVKSIGAIEVTDQSGRKVGATVTFSGSKSTIAFASPVTSGTILNIDMKEVAKGSINPHFFQVSSVTNQGNISFGLVRIQTY